MSNMFKLSSKLQCDVLIVGAGGAGLRCAAHILDKRPGSKIIAVTKVSHPQTSHTSTAQGGLAAVDPSDPVDKPIYHMFDTSHIAEGLHNRAMPAGSASRRTRCGTT